ncbi:MAG: DNA-directed RNA polymerase subunit beta', partial [Robiginitomaculum sp.]|nr:DNA-directed RNA polymerase subunit beta' [Robiginitomaculum sp.]
GSKNQMKQLAGMRGLMAKPSGEIIETPIISNFKEGLSVSEYFSSTHGARKGLADTALKTANSGYLTRRLVDVAQDSIIRAKDCGTDLGIQITPVIRAGEVMVSIGERVLGRVCAEDIVHPTSGDLLAAQDTFIEEKLMAEIDAAEVLSIKVRSPLTCETKQGVCGTCYGRDLARGVPVSMGEAVGVIAAQSIGEPGTQLTMRTFHIGGAAQVSEQSFIETAHAGKVMFENNSTVTDANGDMIVLSRSMVLSIVDAKGIYRESYKIQDGSRILVKEKSKIKRGQRVCDWDPYSLPIITEAGGTIKLLDTVDGVSVKDETDEATGITSKVIIDWRASGKRGDTLQPKIAVLDDKGEPVKIKGGKIANYVLAVGSILSVDDGDTVAPGAVIARVATEGAKNKDITGGLPRVAELFEARKPKDHAILADIDGKVEFGRDYKNKRKIFIVPEDEDEPKSEFLVPKGKHMNVQDGDMIKRGEALLDGNPAPHDILQIMGVEALASYLVTEIQDVYRLQGVPINDKHIEVIVRQMLQKVEVIDGGETDLLKGEQLDRLEYDKIREKAEADKLKPAKVKPVLLGITKASLQTNSFISAASFQETTRVLTQAAVEGKSDYLEGLKENVIVGRLIPAGTGAAHRVMQKVADERDIAELAAREANKAEGLEPLPDEISNSAD